MKKKTLLCLLFVVVITFIGLTAASCSQDGYTPVPEGSETGKYYCDVGGQENLLILNNGDRFALTVSDDSKSGSYTLSGTTLTLTFHYEEDGVNVATFEDGVITLEYKGNTYRFIKIVNYTVSFETNGGSTVGPISVRNGRIITNPPVTTRDGHDFIGWFTSNELTTKFDFGTPITKPVTIYAGWHKPNPGASEFTIGFDLKYESAPVIASQKTVNGKLTNAPAAPARDGYTFVDWYVSMLNDGEKLSYACTKDTVFAESTTLYALWVSNQNLGTKLPAPVVYNVSAGSVNWNTVQNMREYNVIVENSLGVKVFEQGQGSNSVNIPFDTYEPGEYKITVTALAQLAANNSAPTVRYFRNKALDRVSLFSVIDPMTFVFNAVQNAANYTLNINCGNPYHTHTALNIGSSTSYDFSNCVMKEGGIIFEVRANATGLLSSTSEKFVYDNTLAKIEDFNMDETNQILSWSIIPNATNYIVSVTCGNSEHSHVVDNGSKTSYSLKECAPRTGGIVVTVYPKTNKYNSPTPSEYKFNKTNLPTPANIRLDVDTLKWNAISGATYEVRINGVTHQSADNFFTINVEDLKLQPNTDYSVTIRAIGSSGNSLWSDAYVISNADTLTPTLSYSNGILTWIPLIGAEYYSIRVNNDPIETISGANKSSIVLSRSGINTVRIWIEGNSEKYISMDINAYAITFDTGIAASVPKQFKAVGDTVTLPNVEKQHYTLANWFTTPGNGGAIFEDGTKYNFTHDIVLYAYLIPIEYDINLDAKGGTVTNNKIKIAYGSDFTIEVPALTPSLEGFTFIGWYQSVTTGNGENVVTTEVRITDEAGVSLKSSSFYSDTENPVTLYAYWSSKVFSFSVNPDETYSVSKNEDADSEIGLLNTIILPSINPNDGIAVTGLGYFGELSSLKKIIIPATITEIQGEAFKESYNLEEIVVDAANIYYSSSNGILFDKNQTTIIYCPLSRAGAYTIPNTVTDIGTYAFDGRSKITSITISASVVNINLYAFRNCTSLSRVTFAPGSKLQTIGNLAFYGCTSLRTITIPKSVEYINEQAFSTSGLISVIFEGNATNALTIGKQAFELCNSLTTVTIESGRNLQTIGEAAFRQCAKITSVYIPNSVETIGINAYTYCNIDKITFEPGSIPLVIQDGAFSANKLSGLIVPARVSAIGASAFGYNGTLSTISFQAGSNLATIGGSAFTQATITSIEIPERVEKIDNGAFSSCRQLIDVTFAATGVATPASPILDLGNMVFSYTSIKNITFPKTVNYIGANDSSAQLFYDCKSLETVTFESGSNIQRLPINTFENCTNLKEINIVNPASTSKFATIDGALYNAAKTQIIKCPPKKTGNVTIPSTLTSIGTDAFAGCIFTSFTVEEGANYAVENGILYNPAKTTLIKCAPGVTGEIIIPDSVTIMSNYAFQNSKISKVTVPGTIAENNFGTNNFQGCTELTEVVLSEGIKRLATYAFAGCSSLDTVKLPTTLINIAGNAFNGCVKLKNIDLSIPTNLTSLSLNSFANCASLETVYIPGTISSIPGSVFENCTGLKTLTIAYAGTSNFTVQASTFKNCTSLTKVILPSRIQAAGLANAFDGCVNIEEFEITSGTAASTVDGVVYGNPSSTANKTILVKWPAAKGGVATIASTITTINAEAFQDCSQITSFVVEGGTSFSVVDGALYNYNKTELIRWPAKKTGTISIPSTVTTLRAYAFADCDWITEITIPSSVTTINNYAFYKCSSLKYIRLPNNVKNLAQGVFKNCTSLEAALLPSAMTSGGGSNLFENCTNLKSVIMQSGANFNYIANVFLNANSATIYAEADTLAALSNWNPPATARPIIYSCTLSETKDYVVSYTKASANLYYNPNSYVVSAPFRLGYTFGGWSTTADGTTAAYSANEIASIPLGTTVYAIWIAA